MDNIEVQELGRCKRERTWFVEVNNEWPDVYFYVWPHRGIHLSNSGAAQFAAQSAIHFESEHLAKIEDIIVENPRKRNAGIGSLLLTFVERWAFQHEVKRLYGDLSSVDKANFTQLRHFYEKHGFSFEVYQQDHWRSRGTTVGRVEKRLKRTPQNP